MNRTSRLSLAIALALIGGNAFALGLGAIQVKSKLNQPLEAEIPVVSDSAAEANGLSVNLASAEDFQRVGLSRARVSMPIDFAVTTDSRGQSVIRVTTKDVVREPFLDFLVEVNWPKGKLLREYTVLLDPPVMAPATQGSTAAVAPVRETAPARPQKLAVQPESAKSPPPRVKTARSTSAEAKPAAPVAERPAHAAAAGQYGPVAAGETLSEVARSTRPDDATNLNEMMLAMLKANPNAFYRDNINALKRGAILRIPSSDEIKGSGSAMAAAAAVREQNEAWGANVPVAKPTLVAKTGAPKSSTASGNANAGGEAKSNEHLALVPPRAGKGSQTTADNPGAAAGTGTSAETKAELARTKEALASREQEASDLKSRVKQLEDLNGKDQRLITLKQSEIADLQNKLKELETGKGAVAAAGAAAAAKAAETPVTPAKPAEATPNLGGTAAAKSDAKLTAKDIWGDISANEKNPAAKPATTEPAASAATATPAKGPETGASPTATPPSATAVPIAVAPTPSAPAAASTPSAVTEPNTSAPESLAATPTPPPAAKPAVKPATPPKPVAPAISEQPWYMNNSVLLAGGAALLLIGLLALMRFMRKPKPVLLPLTPITGIDEHDGAVVSEDEHHLLDELAQRPGDAALSLELLNLYYTQHDAGKFEAAAEAMYAHLADPAQPEWQQVRAMGEELCPHNPLFGGHEDLAATGAYVHDEHLGEEHGEMDHLDAGLHGGDGHAHDGQFDLGGGFDAPAKPADEESFDFDLADHTAQPVHADAGQEPVHVSDHPTPPPPAFVPPAAHEAAFESAPVAAVKPAEDFFGGEDAIGTKLDLAKAYLDMGDPEGARSMLDEVMAEGNDAQKGEARKLLAEIR